MNAQRSSQSNRTKMPKILTNSWLHASREYPVSKPTDTYRERWFGWEREWIVTDGNRITREWRGSDGPHNGETA